MNKPIKNQYFSNEDYQIFEQLLKTLDRFRIIFFCLFFFLLVLVSAIYHLQFGFNFIIAAIQIIAIFTIIGFIGEKVHSYFEFLFFKRSVSEKEKRAIKIESYFKDLSKYYNDFLRQNLPVLDKIKSENLYRKRIGKQNFDKWESYKELINEIPLKTNYRVNIENKFLRNLSLHREYMIKRIENSLKSKFRISNVDQNKIIKLNNTTSNYTPEQFRDKIKSKKKSKSNNYELMAKVGEIGEKIIMIDQRKRIEENVILDSEYPIHVSKDHGDEFGFDIMSINNGLEPLYIEVKTTVGQKSNEFIMTKNEMEKLRMF